MVCVYHSPTLSLKEDSQLFQALTDAKTAAAEVIIVGDFSLLLVNWQVETSITGTLVEEFLRWLHEQVMH